MCCKRMQDKGGTGEGVAAPERIPKLLRVLCPMYSAVSAILTYLVSNAKLT